MFELLNKEGERVGLHPSGNLKELQAKFPALKVARVKEISNDLLAKESVALVEEGVATTKAYAESEEGKLELEFQAELKAEADAAIEEKRQAFMKKRKAKK